MGGSCRPPWRDVHSAASLPKLAEVDGKISSVERGNFQGKKGWMTSRVGIGSAHDAWESQ